MTTPFSLDDVSSSRMMSMAERQAQLVQQRRQIIRQKSQVNYSNLSTKNESRQTVEASGFGKSQSVVAHYQVANSTASDKIVVRSPSPSELSCTSTVVAKQQCSSDEPKLTENCKDGSDDADKENQQQAIHLLELELDRKKKELEETRAKLEAKEKAEVDRLCKENESRQQELQLHTSSTDDVKDTSSTDDNRHEIANVSSTTYSSGGSTLGGSDSGYQRYLDAYHHHPPKETLQIKEPSDPTKEISNYLSATSDISDLTGSRRLSSTSSSRPISRAARRSSQESSSSVAAPKIVSSTTILTKQSSNKEAPERQSLQDESSKNQKQEPRPTKSDPREPSHRRSLPSLQQQLTSIGSANLDDPIVMRSILMNPCPKDGRIVQCCIRRNKGKATLGIGLYPEYRCYLRENKNSRTETFLMTAKKRAANKTSNYLISMGRNDHDKDSKNILGKLRGDSKEYILFDNGKNPDDCSQEDDVRKELGAILYTSSCLGNKGPRNISVGIGKKDEEGNPVKVWQPLHKHDDSMMDCLKKIDGDEVSHKDKKLLIHLQSKPPAWDEKLERFFLNFNGRVTMASVKNFQLVDEDGDMCLQFGRTGKDEFILDVQWPLSPFQAFALALSSFDSRVGCD
jgi:tubby-related protein 1